MVIVSHPTPPPKSFFTTLTRRERFSPEIFPRSGKVAHSWVLGVLDALAGILSAACPGAGITPANVLNYATSVNTTFNTATAARWCCLYVQA
jgi:hypothetical protein